MKPQAGQIGYLHFLDPIQGKALPTVRSRFKITRVDGNLAFARYTSDEDPDSPFEEDAFPFIWQFKDGPNKIHIWPGHPDYLTFHGEPA